jgi:hypothetical protein
MVEEGNDDITKFSLVEGDILTADFTEEEVFEAIS